MIRDDVEAEKYMAALWAEVMDRLELGLPVAPYEHRRLLERLEPVLEQIEPRTVH